MVLSLLLPPVQLHAHCDLFSRFSLFSLQGKFFRRCWNFTLFLFLAVFSLDQSYFLFPVVALILL